MKINRLHLYFKWHVCLCVHAYIQCVGVNMYVCTCMCVFQCVCMRMCVRARVCVYVCTCVCLCISTEGVHACMCTVLVQYSTDYL